VISTSQHQAFDQKIIDTSQGLWKNEKSFRVTKTDSKIDVLQKI
jgi:hypothetical protein